MGGETSYDARLRDLEAEAFRTGRTLAEHGEQLERIGEQQRTAFGNIDSIADAIGAPGQRSVIQRLDALEHRLGVIDAKMDDTSRTLDNIHDVLRAVARAVGVGTAPDRVVPQAPGPGHD